MPKRSRVGVDPLMESFPDLLNAALELAKARGVTQREIAAKVGIQESRLSNLRSGTTDRDDWREVKLKEALALARALEFPPEVLLLGDKSRLTIVGDGTATPEPTQQPDGSRGGRRKRTRRA